MHILTCSLETIIGRLSAHIERIPSLLQLPIAYDLNKSEAPWFLEPSASESDGRQQSFWFRFVCVVYLPDSVFLDCNTSGFGLKWMN